jgi:hypothetical protein
MGQSQVCILIQSLRTARYRKDASGTITQKAASAIRVSGVMPYVAGLIGVLAPVVVIVVPARYCPTRE